MRIFRAICLSVCLVFAATGASATDLRIAVASEVTTLDPHFFHLTSNTEIHKAIYSGLVTQDANMKVVPDLAISWRTIDETHWEFKLRPGVTFHDGSPFTADDVVFTYTRARSVPNHGLENSNGEIVSSAADRSISASAPSTKEPRCQL